MSGSGVGRARAVVVAVAAAVVGAAGAVVYVAGGPGERGDGAGEGGEPAGEAERGLSTREEPGRSRWLEMPVPSVTFRTLDGDAVSLDSLRGRTAVVNFWATWCPPCEREIPELVQLQDSLAGTAATVVGIAVSSGTAAEVRAYAREHGVNYPLWTTDQETLVSRFRSSGIPLTLLVDSAGIVRRRYMGPQTYDRLAGDLRALREGRRPPGPGG